MPISQQGRAELELTLVQSVNPTSAAAMRASHTVRNALPLPGNIYGFKGNG